MTRMASTVAALSGVTHLYGKTRALETVSVDIPSGCLAGLIGPDGAGKSTMLGLIAGARRIQRGQVSVLGGDMARARHRNAVCSRIAYLPQGLGSNLYAELSVNENLDFFGHLFGQPVRERRARSAALLSATGLAPFSERPAGKLSGGMKQKLGLCCALIHDPDLLILDEPTTGVDPLSRRRFWDLIRAIRGERPEMSLLISTAYMEEAEQFDWLMAMDTGKVLATGTPDELKLRTGRETLENAFVALLPEDRRGRAHRQVTPPRPHDGEPPVIVARELTRQFGGFTAVDHVSFEIHRGEVFGFLGANGCGKTTTMKMLTGLLPATQGEAWLFGRSVKAGDAEARRRVGYMSQSFSLYGELSVHENLLLHARLYSLPANRVPARVNALIHRFGLADHRYHLAEQLPLGLRQRLSLAVAIIHGPEMLILDEPTSGVDPVARDDFWDLLIELSRQEKVTIFISTHFMSEAMRCDRISLMHAGRVLACAEPNALIAARGAANLEEAFIGFMEAADGEAAPADHTDAPRLPASPRGRVAQRGSSFHLGRMFAYCRRESLEILRDPVRVAFAFAGSLLLMIVFGFGITTDVNEVRFAVCDLDQTPESRAYIQSLSGSAYFRERPEAASEPEIRERLQTNDIAVAVEIPPGFGRNLKRGAAAEVSAWFDGSHPSRAETIRGYIHGAHSTFLQGSASGRHHSGASQVPVRIEPRYCYNPSFKSIYAMVPAIPPILLMLLPAILVAVSMVREKELGSIINFYVTPSQRLEYILGKQLPYIAAGMLNFGLLTVLSIVVFQVPLKGSAVALTAGALVYLATTTNIGCLVSTFTSSQMAAVFGTAILTMMPTIQFSGLMQPVSTLEGVSRFLGMLWPTNYYMHMSVGAFTKALGASDLMGDLAALVLCVPVLTLLNVLALRKQAR